MSTQCLGVELGHSMPGVVSMGAGPPGWEVWRGVYNPTPKKKPSQECSFGPKVWRRSIMEAKAHIGL